MSLTQQPSGLRIRYERRGGGARVGSILLPAMLCGTLPRWRRAMPCCFRNGLWGALVSVAWSLLFLGAAVVMLRSGGAPWGRAVLVGLALLVGLRAALSALRLLTAPRQRDALAALAVAQMGMGWTGDVLFDARGATLSSDDVMMTLPWAARDRIEVRRDTLLVAFKEATLVVSAPTVGQDLDTVARHLLALGRPERRDAPPYPKLDGPDWLRVV